MRQDTTWCMSSSLTCIPFAAVLYWREPPHASFHWELVQQGAQTSQSVFAAPGPATHLQHTWTQLLTQLRADVTCGLMCKRYMYTKQQLQCQADMKHASVERHRSTCCAVTRPVQNTMYSTEDVCHLHCTFSWIAFLQHIRTRSLRHQAPWLKPLGAESISWNLTACQPVTFCYQLHNAFGLHLGICWAGRPWQHQQSHISACPQPLSTPPGSRSPQTWIWPAAALITSISTLNHRLVDTAQCWICKDLQNHH